MSSMNPLSIPGGWNKDKQTPSKEEDNPVDSSSVPRTAAGTVNETGDILDQAGKSIGKIPEGQDPKELAGNTVNASGEILGKGGDVLGKATDLNIGGSGENEDDNVSEYTTKGVEEGDSSSGYNVLGKTKNLFSGLTGSNKGSQAGGSEAGDTLEKTKEGVEDTAEDAKDKTEEVKDDAEAKAGETQDQAEETKDDLEKKAEDTAEDAQDKTEEVKDDAAAKAGETEGQVEETKDDAEKTAEDAKDDAEKTGEEATEDAEKTAEDTKAEAEKTGEEATEDAEKTAEEAKDEAEKTGEEATEEAEKALDFSVLKDAKVNKLGNITNQDGQVVGKLTEGEAKKLVGRVCDENGVIWDNGKQIGKGEPLPNDEREDLQKHAPFENFPDAVVEADGKVMFEGKQVGVVVEGDPKKLKGSKVDEDGEILSRGGDVIGRAEAWDEPEPEEEVEEKVDRSILKGAKVNKKGYLTNDQGDAVGKLVEGDVNDLVGKTADEEGQIWADGKVVGKAEVLADQERRDTRSKPFENFPDAVVESDGKVMYEGKQVGVVVEGDAKQLKGSTVDADGEILNRSGDKVGRAERWEEPEAEPEEEVDMSSLAGKRVNKKGNVVDGNGQIFGRVIEGDVSKLTGRMCNKKGEVVSESGDVIGKAELVSEGEREGQKEGPFAELSGCTVAKDGTVVTPSGDIVGRLTSGDGKKLFGRSVDEQGDVTDANGNVLGSAERWEPEEVEKKKGKFAGRKVNKDGSVLDEDGNVIGKLVEGDPLTCQGKEIDDDGDVINSKGASIGHVVAIEDVPEPEPEEEESPEDKAKREEAEKDKKLASQLAYQIEQSLEKIRPICKRITDKIDHAESQKKEDLDEEQLVKDVKPLLEEGGRILTEANGVIRGMDPDGRIQRNAKQKAASREATPEEFHLADVLKELTGTVTECIDNGKRKIEGMPHAKKELSPLWGLLSEPLFQILAAVGLLLNGVLGIVGRLLSGLGLGGLVDGLLGSLGLDKILGGLGLGDALGSLTGKKK